MSVEQLVVKKVEGTGKGLLEQRGQVNAFLGISLGKGRFFTKSHIGMYLDWALEHCANFLVLVDDWEERNNYKIFKGLDDDWAATLAIQRGQEMARAISRVWNKLAPDDRNRIHIVRSAELFEVPGCSKIAAGVLIIFQKDPKFQRDVYDQIYTNIGGKIRDWKKTVSELDYSEGRTTMARYLLEEIGVTVFVRNMGYPVEVYPGPAMRVVRNLYQGSYPGLSEMLGLKEDWGYIHLDIKQAIPKQAD